MEKIKKSDSEILAQTVFYVSLISLIVFSTAEFLCPGFVTRYVSLYWFVIVTTVSAVWWMRTLQSKTPPPF